MAGRASTVGKLARARVCAAATLAAALLGAAAADEDPRAGGPSAANGAAEPQAEEQWAATTAGEVVPPGRIQVEAAVIYEDRAPGQRWAIDTPLAIRFGLIPRFEARVDFTPYVAFRDDRGHTEEGKGDTALSGKFLTNEQIDLFPAIALGAFVKIPTASEKKGLGSGEVDLGGRIDATTYWLPEVFYTDFSFTGSLLGEGRGHYFFRPSIEFLLGYDGFAPATLYTLLTWEGQEAAHEHDSLVLSFGAFFFLQKTLAIDMGIDLPLTGVDPDWGFFVFLLWMTPEIW